MPLQRRTHGKKNGRGVHGLFSSEKDLQGSHAIHFRCGHCHITWHVVSPLPIQFHCHICLHWGGQCRPIQFCVWISLKNTCLAPLGAAHTLGVPHRRQKTPRPPGLCFAAFQMTFAIIASAIISGSLVERMRFSSLATSRSADDGDVRREVPLQTYVSEVFGRFGWISGVHVRSIMLVPGRMFGRERWGKV